MKAILLSILLIVLVTSPPPPSSTFTLTFDYAPRLSAPLQTSLANVIWNNGIILSVVPTDYDIHTATIDVTAIIGANILQFEGTGASDYVGLGITNVALVRQGDSTNTNILINGDFSQPNQPNQGRRYHYYDNIPGWIGLHIEIGFGDIYNAWPNGIQICELDSEGNYEITQTLTFDSNFQMISSPSNSACLLFFTFDLILQFDWAPNTVGTQDLLTSQADILWNDVILDSIVPNSTTNGVNHKSYTFLYDPCRQNYLQIDGAQKSDGFGMSISNIQITTGLGFPVAANDWIAVNPEYADCQTFNTAWSTGRCLSLDSGTNQRYSRLITYTQKAFDIVGPLTQTAFGCLLNQGYAYVSVRASSNTPGVIDPNAIQTLLNAQATGLQTAIYLVVCPSSNFVNQLSAILSSIPFRLYSIAWLKIIQNTPDCSWQTYTNTTANCASLGQLVNMVSKLNSVGLFSTKNIWNRVFGTTCTEYGSIAHLWYADYQSNGVVDPTPSFADFMAYGGFAGTTPDLKQVGGAVKVTLCNNPSWHALIDINWHL